MLAAELGKALLEKNEELVKQQEKIIEEYSNKLEVRSIDLLISGICILVDNKEMNVGHAFCGVIGIQFEYPQLDLVVRFINPINFGY